MITPIEIQKTVFKTSAHGYSRSQVDEFKEIVLKDYETLYRQALDMNDKMAAMQERIQYYSTMEKSLHKALVLAEKSAEETKRAAEIHAQSIEKEARAHAQSIVNQAKQQLNYLHDATLDLLQQYESYKAQMIACSKAQIQLLSSDAFKLDPSKLDAYKEFVTNTGEETK